MEDGNFLVKTSTTNITNKANPPTVLNTLLIIMQLTLCF